MFESNITALLAIAVPTAVDPRSKAFISPTTTVAPSSIFNSAAVDCAVCYMVYDGSGDIEDPNVKAPKANFKIIITVPLFSNEGNLNGIEDNIVRVFNLLAASSYTYNVTDVSAPAVLSAVSGDLLTCNINISVLTSWS